VRGQLHAPATLSPGKEPPRPGVCWIRGWVGPRPSLDAAEKRKILPLPGIEPRLLTRRPSLEIIEIV
jgi:hypothetical protein